MANHAVMNPGNYHLGNWHNEPPYFKRKYIEELEPFKNVQFKTAVLHNRRIYVGNVKVTYQDGTVENLGDTMFRSKAGQFDKYMKVVDGSIYTVADFGVARYSAIARAIASMAKLGGATISAAADIGIYGSEMRFQGRSFLGGMAEALTSLGRIKNTKQKKDIAQMLGFIVDNTIYDMSARYQVGDNLSKGWSNAQRTFFKKVQHKNTFNPLHEIELAVDQMVQFTLR